MARTKSNGSTKLHALVWMKYVQSCYPNETLYSLDVLFGQVGWSRVDCQKQDLSKNRKPKGEIKKPFSRLTRTLELPRLFKKGQTQQVDLPTRVSCRKESEKSLEIFTSKLWRLLKARPFDVKENDKLLKELLIQFDVEVIIGKQALALGLGGQQPQTLIAIEGEEPMPLWDEIAKPILRGNSDSVQSAIAQVLRNSLRQVDLGKYSPFDVLALYGALYRNAFHRFNDTHIGVYRELFLEKLDATVKDLEWLRAELGKWSTAAPRAHENFKDMLTKIVLYGVTDAPVQDRGKVAPITKEELGQFAFFRTTHGFITPNPNW